MTEPLPCRLLDIDLAAALPAITALGEEQSVLAFFWKDNVPVGRRLFLRSDLPVHATALASIAAKSATETVSLLGSETNTLDGPAPEPSDVSVLVCTRDRLDHLRRCIDALTSCDPAPGEIIVIDNSSTPGTLDDLVAGYPEVRLIEEPRKGLSIARNTGLAAATGTIIAFTDDDVAVPPNWVQSLAHFFADPEVGAITGPVLPAQLDTEAEFAFEMEIGGLAASLKPRDFDVSFLNTGPFKAPHVWEIGAGANMAIRKSAADALGGFDERLGAGASGCSEDSEFLYRLLAANWHCRYRPEVHVRHFHRGDTTALRRQMRTYMRGHVAALLVQFQETRHVGNFARILLGLPMYFAGWLIKRLASVTGFAWVEPWDRTARSTQLAHIRGSVEGLVYWLRHFRKPKFTNNDSGKNS